MSYNSTGTGDGKGYVGTVKWGHEYSDVMLFNSASARDSFLKSHLKLIQSNITWIEQDNKVIVDYIFDTYEKLGYEIIFTSALDKIGIDDLEEILEGKTSALCGMSGVGKSTLINAINPELHLKTKSISEKTTCLFFILQHSFILFFQKKRCTSFQSAL